MYSVDNGVYYFDYNLYKDLMYTSDSFRTQWFIGGVSNFRLFLLQFLMYLSSKEADIIESPETIKTYKPSSLVKNKYSEVRKWNVGCRYGEKIRSYQKIKCNNMRTVKAVRMESDHILEKLIGRGIMWEKGEKILLQNGKSQFL